MSLQAKIFTALVLVAMAIGLAFAAVAGYEWWASSKVDQGKTLGRAEVQAKWDEDRAQAAAAALNHAHDNARETVRRLEAQQRNQREQDALLARVRRDNAALAGAVDRLQLRASTYLDAAGCGALSGDSAVECVRKAAGQIVDVLGRCAARHRQLAADADDARARGLKCEADYDALTLRPTS